MHVTVRQEVQTYACHTGTRQPYACHSAAGQTYASCTVAYHAPWPCTAIHAQHQLHWLKAHDIAASGTALRADAVTVLFEFSVIARLKYQMSLHQAFSTPMMHYAV